jgi:DNA repair exonuclease SbcCD ATPase subunit
VNLEERIILWLVQHEAASEERDLLNDALEELERTREQLQAVCDGVNVRCGCDINQLPLVSLDRLVAENERLTRWRDLAVAAAAAGADQEVLKRFAESEAILPIIQAWKDKVADLTARLAAAEAAVTDRDEVINEADIETDKLRIALRESSERLVVAAQMLAEAREKCVDRSTKTVQALGERDEARDAARYFWEVIHGELSAERARELASLYPWVDYLEGDGIALHKCRTCGGVKVTEQELCKCVE